MSIYSSHTNTHTHAHCDARRGGHLDFDAAFSQYVYHVYMCTQTHTHSHTHAQTHSHTGGNLASLQPMHSRGDASEKNNPFASNPFGDDLFGGVLQCPALLLCVAVCCCVLQCVTLCCNFQGVLMCVAVCCSVW